MTDVPTSDRANGYEAFAGEFMAGRGESDVGVADVRGWARELGAGATILDLGCGHGVPIAKALIEDGFSVYGVDASVTMTSAFRRRFPEAPVACERVEDSQFFNRTFDGAVAWGLMFLLAPETQVTLIRKVGSVLMPGGRFLFTSPEQGCAWTDLLTRRESRSLGFEAYESALHDAGFALVGTHRDQDDNHYYDAVRVKSL
jgi:2-polyprenyl-3-methyl-5-hydroxy-6-metoxy-1,4-benzoquinol methylase